MQKSIESYRFDKKVSDASVSSQNLNSGELR